MAEGPWSLSTQGLMVRYNRAEGGFLGWRQARRYRSPWGVAHFGELGRGLASDTWRYQAGGELFTFYGPPAHDAHLASIGAELHDLSDTQDGWRVSEEENSLDAVLFRRDHRDYYRRTGGSLYTAHNVGGVLQATGRWSLDRFESMAGATEWSLFDRSWAAAAFRPNPAVDEGEIRSLRADVQLDTRDRRGNPRRGWLVHAMAERAGGVLGGDQRFKRYLVDVRRYQPTGRGARLDARLRAGSAKGRLPSQYAYRLGGLGSLRGYGFKAFEGDRSVLLNAQYWVDADRHWQGDSLPVEGLGIGVFADAGAAWYAGRRADPYDGFRDLALGVGEGPQWKRTVGLSVGTAADGFRLDFARPLDAGGAGDDAGWTVEARITRAF